MVRGAIEPLRRSFLIPGLLEYVKADGLDIRRTNAEAIAFLLPDLRHAEVFGIGIHNGEAMRLLPHQAIETRRFSIGALRLAA